MVVNLLQNISMKMKIYSGYKGNRNQTEKATIYKQQNKNSY